MINYLQLKRNKKLLINHLLNVLMFIHTKINIILLIFHLLKMLNSSMTLWDLNKLVLITKISWLLGSSSLLLMLVSSSWLSHLVSLIWIGLLVHQPFHFSSGCKSCISTWKEENPSLNHFWCVSIEELLKMKCSKWNHFTMRIWNLELDNYSKLPKVKWNMLISTKTTEILRLNWSILSSIMNN